jgi:alkylhydroperoxidase family enzyme
VTRSMRFDKAPRLASRAWPPSAPSRASLVRNCGSVDRHAFQAFLAAGYSRRQALEVVMGMAFSVMGSYAAHLTRPPLDEFLKPLVWTR